MDSISPDEEKEILKEIHNNCAELLVMKTYDMVYRVIMAKLKKIQMKLSEDEVNDIRHDAYVRMFENNYKRLKQYDPSKGLDLKGWIILITNNAVIDYFAKKLREKKVLINYRKLLEDLKIMEEDEDAEKKDVQIKHIKKVLPHLKPNDELAIQLYYFYECSVKLLAFLMDITESNAHTRLHRARESLKQHIKKLKDKDND